MTVRIAADLNGLTWGELYYLTDCARRAGVLEDDEVEATYDSNANATLVLDAEPEALSGVSAPALISAEDARDYIRGLQAIVDDEGDARGYTKMLQSLISDLRG